MTECLTIHMCINHSKTINQRKIKHRLLHSTQDSFIFGICHQSHPPSISQISGELGFHFSELEFHQLPDSYRLRLQSSSMRSVELRLITTARKTYRD